MSYYCADEFYYIKWKNHGRLESFKINIERTRSEIWAWFEIPDYWGQYDGKGLARENEYCPGLPELVALWLKSSFYMTMHPQEFLDKVNGSD